VSISVLCNSADSNTFCACGASNDRMIVNNESESAWKEAFVSRWEVQCDSLLERTENDGTKYRSG